MWALILHATNSAEWARYQVALMELCYDILVSLLTISAEVGRPVFEAEVEAHNSPKLVPLLDHTKTPLTLILKVPLMCQIQLK